VDVIDLTDEYKPLYLMCLEDWSGEMKEAGTRKELWYDRMKNKGLRVKLARDDTKKVGGMVQYGPIEHSFVKGTGLYFIYCIWVHGHKQGRGNFQKKGMGKALLQAAEADAREMGAKGMAAWGVFLPFWMKASWFKKQGYSKVDRQGISVLLWKPFTDDAAPPKWMERAKIPETPSGKVTVTAFSNGWCQVQNIVVQRAKKAAADFGEEVVFREIDTSDRNELKEWQMVYLLMGRKFELGRHLNMIRSENLSVKRLRNSRNSNSI
jgi:GNAT superfamily N-acetyltransferase